MAATLLIELTRPLGKNGKGDRLKVTHEQIQAAGLEYGKDYQPLGTYPTPVDQTDELPTAPIREDLPTAPTRQDIPAPPTRRDVPAPPPREPVPSVPERAESTAV